MRRCACYLPRLKEPPLRLLPCRLPILLPLLRWLLPPNEPLLPLLRWLLPPNEPLLLLLRGVLVLRGVTLLR